MKLTFPMASSPWSKKEMIPRNVKNTPKPVKPNPTSDVPVEYMKCHKTLK